MSDMIAARAAELHQEQTAIRRAKVDRLFAMLLIAQWVACIVAAIVISPYAWEGKEHVLHMHVWVAILGGAGITILPVILFAEFLFTGSAFPVNKTPGLEQASYLASAKWGYSAAASTANADVLLGTGCNDTSPRGPLPGAKCDSTQAHKSATWYGDIAALSALTMVCIAGAWLAIRPVGQPKQK